MGKCDCYIEDRLLVDYTPLMKPIYKTVSLCFGTRERDQCSCGGDQTKCDFYPEVREKAQNEPTRAQTNSEYIRAMNDDELADFFFESPEVEFGVCYYCKNFGGYGSPEPCKTPHGCCEVEAKNEAFKKWLKQPVKE